MKEYPGVTLRARMRAFRVYFDMTQAKAAEWCQVSLSTWSGWENGRRPIPYREWQRVAAKMEELYAPHDAYLRRRLEWRMSEVEGAERERSDGPSTERPRPGSA